MAALTITAASVVLVSGAVGVGIGGEAIDAGQVVTGSGTSSDKYMLADADAATAPTGVALCKCYLDGGYLVIAKTGAVVTIGATVATGTAYYAHTTAGSIGLESDLASGDWAHLLGFATTTANIELKLSTATSAKA